MKVRKSLGDQVCQECGKVFPSNFSAEEKLLRAVFGQQTLCPECQRKTLPNCGKCNEPIEEGEGGLMFGGVPFHARCLPGA